jgi:ABC-type sugar transport system substrate-binding protein
MKRFLFLALVAVLAIGLLACSTPAGQTSQAPASSAAASSDAAPASQATTSAASEHKVIGFYKDAADDYYKCITDTLFGLVAQDPDIDWEIIDKTGQGTAPEQIAAVEDFITTGVDAMLIVENSPQAAEECISKANAANIPYFAVTHLPSVPAGGELAGFVGYDFEKMGELNGESAVENDVSKVIMIEGKLGQGTAGAFTLGFLTSYTNAGKDIGGTAEDVAANKTTGGKDLQIVYWGSGGWFADPAKKAMTDAITSLGPQGFDGAYVENNEMMDGAIQAIQESGLNPSDYWLGSCNGKEKSWQWVRDGLETMDINQTPALEAEAVYQQLKAYFAGEDYRKYLHPYVTPFNKDNIDSLTLVPFVAEDYLAQRENFVTDINDPKWTDATAHIMFK